MKRDLPQSVAQEEALFSSAHAALTFALNFSGQQFGKSAVAEFAAPAGGGSGKGLGGLDGAAQAGMVKQELHSCGLLVESLLVARVAQDTTVCSCNSACCSGRRANKEYQDALGFLTMECAQFFAGMLSLYSVRRGLIRKHFGEKVSLKELALDAGCNEKTVYSQNEKISAWLKGTDRDHSGQEAKAWMVFENKLKNAGLIK